MHRIILPVVSGLFFCIISTLASEPKTPPLHFGYGAGGSRSNIGLSNLGPYAAMSRRELHQRFTKPEWYEGRDDFARANALSALLERRFLRRGLTKQQVQTLLGVPGDRFEDLEKFPEPFWSYHHLFSSGLSIYFDPRGRVARISWTFDSLPHSPFPDRSRYY